MIMNSLIKKFIFTCSAFLVLGVFFWAPSSIAEAVNIQEEFSKALQSAQLISEGDQPTTPEVAVGKIINTVLTYVGVLTLVMIIYAGGLWATARGNEQTIEKSKKILLGGIIGLVIIFSAAALVNFVISGLGEALQ